LIFVRETPKKTKIRPENLKELKPSFRNKTPIKVALGTSSKLTILAIETGIKSKDFKKKMYDINVGIRPKESKRINVSKLKILIKKSLSSIVGNRHITAARKANIVEVKGLLLLLSDFFPNKGYKP